MTRAKGAGRPINQEGRERTRQRILSGALMVFRAEGYRGASAAAVARTSGVNTRICYRHFPGGKAEMFAALLALNGSAFMQEVHGAEVHRDAMAALDDLTALAEKAAS